MQAMQRTHGNRAVQRFMQRGSSYISQSALPAVQRVDEPTWPSDEEQTRDLGDIDQLNQPERDYGDIDDWAAQQPPRDLGSADDWLPDSQISSDDIQSPQHYPDTPSTHQPAPESNDTAVNDAAKSLAWDAAGSMPGIGTGVSAAATGIDLYNAGKGYLTGDDAAGQKGLDDAKLDAIGLIPGLGTAVSMGSAWHDAFQLGQRVSGASAAESPTVGDRWNKAMGEIRNTPWQEPSVW